jgi:hypothetical protein
VLLEGCYKEIGTVKLTTRRGIPRLRQITRFRTSLDPLDVAQWQFLVLRTTVLNERCAMQKRIGLRALRSLGPREASFEGLKVAIEAEVGLGAAGELRSLGA